MTKELEIKTGEYKIVDRGDELKLVTKNLGADIAFSCFSSKLNKVALGRNLNNDQLKKLFLELNPDQLHDSRLIEINIVGGDESPQSRSAAETLLEQLKLIDNESNILNVRSYDVGKKVHPDSFSIDCYHGGVNPYEVNSGNPNKWQDATLSFVDMEKAREKNRNSSKNCNII